MIEIIINGETFKADNYDCSPTLVSTGDRTQTLDGADHVENQMMKWCIKASFADRSRDETARLLRSVLSSRYITVTFQSPLNEIKTSDFILQNNPSIPVKIWKTGLQYYENISIELLEKGAAYI